MTEAQLKTWIAGFSNSLATGEQAERKLLRIAVDVSTSAASTPSWEILGGGIESSDLETNPEVESKQDILGNNRTSVKKFEPAQSLDPYTVEGGSAIHDILTRLFLLKEKSGFSQFKILVMYGWMKNEKGDIYAEIHKNSTITMSKYGGDSYVDMPIDIKLSNDKTYGTVSDLDDPTFTEATVTA